MTRAAYGNLCCFDASKNTEDKKPYFNWFDRDNSFIAGVKKAPPCTEVFWLMLMKIDANLGDMCKEIFNAITPAEIVTLRKKKIKVEILEDNDIVATEESLISPEIRSMVDNICYMAVYADSTVTILCLSRGYLWRGVMHSVSMLSGSPGTKRTSSTTLGKVFVQPILSKFVL
jgi:hypothetical protein